MNPTAWVSASEFLSLKLEPIFELWSLLYIMQRAAFFRTVASNYLSGGFNCDLIAQELQSRLHLFANHSLADFEHSPQLLLGSSTPEALFD